MMETFHLKSLISAAKEDTDEGWQFIDAILAKEGAANQPELLPWAKENGLHDTNGYVRDLAVSILEKSTLRIDEKTKNILLNHMQNDTNPYVQFRSAFTLFNKGIKTTKVIAKIREALTDPDVKEIAGGYLKEV